jgi:hypothetical protein
MEAPLPVARRAGLGETTKLLSRSTYLIALNRQHEWKIIGCSVSVSTDSSMPMAGTGHPVKAGGRQSQKVNFTMSALSDGGGSHEREKCDE